jgi:hypothetical protein
MKQETTLEEVAERLYPNGCDGTDRSAEIYRRIFIEGAKWQQEKSYSEEEVYDLMDKREHYWVRYKNYYLQSYIPFDEWFEQFKKK